jgi:hypothetical protein
MCKKVQELKNDGMNEIPYVFGDDKDLNGKISFILNEACHVFHHHADGNWKAIYKPKYASMLSEQISEKPSLIRKLLMLNDPVVSNITHAAIEITKNT